MILFICRAGYSQITPTPTPTIHYIGNEGILIESGDQNIIVDGLHSYYDDPYLFPDDELVTKMMNGEGIFHHVNLLLVSHVHGDHFNASMVAEFLEKHKETTLVSSQQVVDSVLKYVDQSVISSSRIESFDLDKTKQSFIIGSINLTLFNLPHSSQRFSWIQNVGNLIEVNGISYLHTGDASLTSSWMEHLALDDYDIDIALMPFWYLMDEQHVRSIKKYAKPDKYIALHVPPSNNKYYPEAIKNWPGVIWFSKKGDQKTLD